MKKFRAKIALILVLSLTLAIAIPALAVGQSTKITGAFEEPEIEVVIPTTASAVINPFGLPVEVFAEDGKSSVGYVGKDGKSLVLTRPLAGYNASLFDLDISATVIGAPKGELMLASADMTPKTKKSVINFEMKTNDYKLNTADTWYYNAADAKTNKDKVIGQLDGELIVGALNEAWTGQKSAVVTENSATVAAIEVKKGKDVGDPGKPVIEPADDGIFFARLTGKVAEEPLAADAKGDPLKNKDNTETTEKVAWTTKDGVDVTVAWTIKLHKDTPAGS